jgi:hypothetical protein
MEEEMKRNDFRRIFSREYGQFLSDYDYMYRKSPEL